MSRIVSVLITVFLLPAAAFAQSAPARDKEAAKFNEIERSNLFFGVQGGWNFLLNAPANSGPRPTSHGQTAMVEVGYELFERLSVSAFLIGSANRASATYVGYSGGKASGDFSALVPGAAVRAHLLGFNDSQDIKRTWLYVRGGAGFMMFSPKPLLPQPDILVFAGPGVEYFTRLRHFSIGLESTATFGVTTGTIGFTATPNVRYIF